MNSLFHDRRSAGQELAKALMRYRDRDAVVLALPRGGVVVGAAVAEALEAPLELVLVRKIGHPWAPECAVGAVTEHYGPHLTEFEPAVPLQWLAQTIAEKTVALANMRETYLKHHQSVAVAGRPAIIVDDGIATGETMRAAIMEVKLLNPSEIVVAVPVAAAEAVERLAERASAVVTLFAPGNLSAVGAYYEDFQQVNDAEVQQIVSRFEHPRVPAGSNRPLDLEALNAVLATADFPTNSRQLVSRARAVAAPAAVVGFFESIPLDEILRTKADVMARSLVTHLIEEEEQREPSERLRSYD